MPSPSQPKRHPPGGIMEMITIALPMVVSFACDTVMIFTDRLFLSKLGPGHMNAAMGGGLSIFMMMAFFLGLVGYTTALVAQYFGAEQKDHCPRVLTQAFVIIGCAYPILLLARPAAHFLFSQAHLDPEQLILQIQYFDLLMFGAIFSLARQALASYFSGIGRTLIVMVASISAMMINGVTNYGLIYGHFGLPILGIQGAALGTIIANACGCLVLWMAYVHREHAKTFAVRQSFVFDSRIMSKLWRFGYPTGIEMALNILLFTLIVMMLHGQGFVAATATTIALNWDMVTFVPLMGFEIGVTSLVGRYLGAKQMGIAQRAVISGLKLGCGYSIFLVVLFVIFPRPLVEFFRPDMASDVFSEAIPLAVSMIKLIPLYVTAVVVMIVYVGALRGAGDTFWAMLITVGIHGIIAAAIFVTLYWMHGTTYAGWVTMIVAFLAVCWLPLWRYRLGKWKDIHLVDEKTIDK